MFLSYFWGYLLLLLNTFIRSLSLEEDFSGLFDNLGDSNLLSDEFFGLVFGLVVDMLTFSVRPPEELESLSL